MRKTGFIFLFACLCCAVGCTKTKSNATDLYNPVAMPQLTQANYVDTLLKEIKHYPQENYYYIFVSNFGCLYELLVNDVPALQMYSNEIIATPTEINDGILKTGKQRLTFRLYPTAGNEVFRPQTDFSFELGYWNNASTTNTFDGDDVTVMKYQLPRTGGQGQGFIATGLDYYEFSIEFDATVPYVNEGWSNGQDLSKLEAKKLEAEVVKFYNKQRDIMIDRNADAMFSYLYKKELEVRQSLYCNKEALEQAFDNYILPITKSSYKYEPLQDFVMKYYGDSRLVALKQENTEDVRLRGESALWGKYDDENGSIRATFRNLYLYLPKGKELNADNFIIIR